MRREQVFPPVEAAAVARVVFADGLDASEWPYPGPGCGESNDCPSCPRWRCPGCRQLRPWCMGAGDKTPELCNDCAMRAATEVVR